MARGNIRVGIGGWTFPEWRDLFYPENWAKSRELEFASRAFGAIEINATFYSRQAPGSWEKWAAATPDDFQFTLKASRFCVTRPKLADAGEGIGNFYAQGVDRLGAKLGPTLWMLARHRQFDRDDIAAFLSLLPQKLGDVPLRHVIEPRHESFRDEAFASLCRDHNAAVVFGDDDEFPCIDLDTAEFRYARLQRMQDEIETGYSPARLDELSTLTRGWAEAGRDAYVFLINGAKRRAPAAAMALQDRLGIARG